MIRPSFAGCSDGADLIYSSWELRGLMITLALNRIALPLAAMLVLSSVAGAQQTAAPNPATAPAKPKPAKPAARHATPKGAPEAAAVAGAQPALLGQYGQWGAYAAQSGNSKVCFALAKPSSSKTSPPNRPLPDLELPA